MRKTINTPRESNNGKSVNNQPELMYQKKIPINSKVFIRNKSKEDIKKDSSSKEFENIMQQMYTEIEQNKNLKGDYEEEVNDFLSPKKILFSPNDDYNSKIMDRFTQISVIKPNKNDIYMEPSSENEIPNEEYIYCYDPKKGIKLELGNSSKKEIKSFFDCYFIDSKLIFQKEINLYINGISNIEKLKYDLKYNELVKKEEEYDNLMNKYNLLLKEINDLKNKNTISSDHTREEEKTIEHLENIIIINNNNNNNKKKRIKIKKLKNKRMKSLTLNLRKVSSSEETKTRDNSQNAFGCSNSSNELNKNKKYTTNIMIISKENELNLTASFNSLLKSEHTSNKTKKKVKKLIKKSNNEKKSEKDLINKENNINWNLLNKVDNNQSFDYFGSINIHPINQIQSVTSPVSSSKVGTNNTNSNTLSNKKVAKNKKKKILIKKRDRNKDNEKGRSTSINSSKKKIKKINLPTINIKNEILSYNIQKRYIRFSTQTQSIDYKYIRTNNLSQINKSLTRCHSESLSINKNPKSKRNNNDIIEKSININIINVRNKNKSSKIIQNLKEKEKNNDSLVDENININELLNNSKNKETMTSNQKKDDESLGNYSENKELSFFSTEIKDISDCMSEEEKHLMKEKKIDNMSEGIANEKSGQKKKEGYPLKIKIVKLGNKKNNSKFYFDVLFQKLVNKLLIKRVLKKWRKITRK